MYLKVAASLLVVFLAVARAGMPGPLVDINMNDQGAHDALQFAVTQHNNATNDAYVSKVSRVIRVQRQVVAGLKYIFTVEMARTSCKKGGVEKVCKVHPNPNIARCPDSGVSYPGLLCHAPLVRGSSLQNVGLQLLAGPAEILITPSTDTHPKYKKQRAGGTHSRRAQGDEHRGVPSVTGLQVNRPRVYIAHTDTENRYHSPSGPKPPQL